MKISGVYEIVNKITGDCYIGSSIDLERRKREHYYESTWEKEPNKQLYKDMKQYGKDNFLLKPIQLCDPEDLKKYEQLAIEKYNPKYNIRDAYTGMSKEEYQKQYNKEHADSIKQYQKQYQKENADSIKQQKKQHYKENYNSIKQYNKQYHNQQCLYENEMLTLCALSKRFAKKGIEHPTLEAKKYLIASVLSIGEWIVT